MNEKSKRAIALPSMSAEALAATLEIISDGIWDWDANTGYVYRSPGWYRMLGYDENSLENSVLTWENVIHKDDYARVMKDFDAYITHKSEIYKSQYRCKMKSGAYLWIEDRGKVVSWNPDNSVARMIGAHRDISAERVLMEKFELENSSLEELIEKRTKELVRLNDELEKKMLEVEHFAITDALTSAANRHHFEQVIEREVVRAHRFGEPLSIVAIDIDHFKQLNDQYGHAGGDSVLIKVSQLITENIREIDLLARWGGDEMILVLPQTALENAAKLAEELRLSIEELAIDGIKRVTASLGVVQLDKDESVKSFFIRADKALYKSKESGRNRVSI